MNELYQKILDENIKLHSLEAKFYEKLHPEGFNWFEQARIEGELEFIADRMNASAIALDVGCGTGNILLKLLPKGFCVWGVDISSQMLDVLKESLPPHSRDKVKLFCRNIDDFIADCPRRFDLITISSTLHHLPEYIETLNKLLGLLNDGGYIYITHEPTSNAFAPDRFLRKVLWQADNIFYAVLNINRIPEVEGRNWRMADYQLYHGFDEEKVIQACRLAGLEITRLTRYSSAMRLGISCWIDTRLLHSVCQFSMIAKKRASARRRDE